LKETPIPVPGLYTDFTQQASNGKIDLVTESLRGGEDGMPKDRSTI
jgi:hypothetical protein